jgi:8-oxo-dGTP pyrophosphatase MutT (NUDIX family)
MSDWLREVRGKVGTMLIEVPSVTVVVRDGAGHVLVVRHSNRGVWVFPGGAVEPEETPADAAAREVYEEAGLDVELTDLIGVFGGPEYVVEYENGDRTSYLMVVFEAVVRSGTPRPDGVETVETRFVTRDELATLPQGRWMPEVADAVFTPTPARRFRPATWRP